MNLEERIDDKVSVRGMWINMSSKAINKFIRAPDHKEDENSVLMDEGVETTELVKKLKTLHCRCACSTKHTYIHSLHTHILHIIPAMVLIWHHNSLLS